MPTSIQTVLAPSRIRLEMGSLLLALIALGCYGCSGNSDPVTTAGQDADKHRTAQLLTGTANHEVPLITGADLYMSYCAACHGAEGRGDGPVATNLKTDTPDLTTLSRRSGDEFPRQRVERYIRNEAGPESHGTPAMPLWGPVFAETTRLDQQTRDKLQVLIDSEVTSTFLADLRVENLLDHIESMQR